MRTAIRLAPLLALLLALPALASPERTAQEIRLTLREMERAVLGADQATYLAQVDTSDAVFLQEQKAWAADLGRHVPVDFSLTLDDTQLVESDGWAEAPLTMRWRMDGPRIDTREPEARQIAFTALFAESFEEPGRWRFAGRKWSVQRGPGVRALCEPGLEEIGQMVVDVFPEVQQAVEAEYGVHVATEQTVKIYGAMADLQASIYLSYTDGLAGWNEPGESIKILSARRTSRDGLRPLLAHEFGHVITFELGVDSDAVAWWILEGVAEVAAEAVGQGSRDRMVERWAENDQLADWDAISDFRTTEGQLMRHVYSQGASMVRYITAEYGAEKRLAWLKRLAAGDSLDNACRAALGAPFDEIDRAWRASLR